MDLIKDGNPKKIHWDDCEKVFHILKDWLCHGPVLFNPDFSKEFVLQTDASNASLEVISSQEVDGKEQPVLSKLKAVPQGKGLSQE